MTALKEIHERIEAHFKKLAETRQAHGGEVFFIEHALSPECLIQLRHELRTALGSHALDRYFWSSAYLPLVVFATEIGYDYEGNGTDFWPFLEKSLGRHFEFEDRRQLSVLFKKASDRYRGVRPGGSEWECAFCHIAWPITHAVAARDIRRPFADCLRRFDGNVADDDTSIVSRLASIPSPGGSRRFRTWLNRKQVVAGIVRELLEGTSLVDANLLTKSFGDRLLADLRNEPEMREAVRTARARAKTRNTRNRARDKQIENAPNEFHYGTFFLNRDDDGRLILFGELPDMPREIQKELRKCRRTWQPRPWGFDGASMLPTNALRSTRGTFPINVRYVARASDGRPFFTGFEELPLDPECRRWLRSVRLNGTERLAFRPVGDEAGDSSHAITTSTPHRGDVWIVCKTGVDWPNFTKRWIAAVERGDVFSVDASESEFRRWMNWPAAYGERPKTSAEATWLYPSPISADADGQLVFTTDDELGISVTGPQPLTLVLRSGRKEIARSEVAAVALAKINNAGPYELAVIDREQTIQAFAFTIVDNAGDGFIEPDPQRPWQVTMSHVDTGETTLSRSDFFNRRIAIDVAGDRSVQDLPMTLSLSPGDCVTHVHLNRIPERIGPSHRVWDDLLEQLPQSVLQSPCDLKIRIEVAGLGGDSWRLEAATQFLWWNDDASAPQALCDEGQLRVKHRTLVENLPIDKVPKGEPVVSVAYDRGGSELTFDARVSVFGDSFLQRHPDHPDRLLRELENIGTGVGLHEVASRYLRVASASSSSRVAEINRVGVKQQLRDWIIEVLCGPNWIKRQHKFAAIERTDPVTVWWEEQLNHSLLLPEPEVGAERRLPARLSTEARIEFAHHLPPDWWDGAVAEIDFAGDLDGVYTRLIQEDVYVDARALTASLRSASERICGGHLADLVIPVTGGDILLAMGLAGWTVDDVAAELERWIGEYLKTGRGRHKWSRVELGDWLSFLLYPERLRRRDWQFILEKLLKDRPVARAGAFLAWRMEQTTRMESFAM